MSATGSRAVRVAADWVGPALDTRPAGRRGPEADTDRSGWCKMVPRMPSTRPERSFEFASKAGRRSQTAGVLALVLLGSASARAQSGPPDGPPPEPKRIVVTFEQRSRVEGLTNPFRLGRLGPTRVLAFRTRLQIALPKIAGPLGAFVELQDSRSTWNDEPCGDAFRYVCESGEVSTWYEDGDGDGLSLIHI